ncbi:hypothetical protein T484DRAFT_1784016, partial [Baffinella frigidus]
FEFDEKLHEYTNEEALAFLEKSLPGAFLPAGRNLEGLVTFGMGAADFDVNKMSGDRAQSLMFKANLLMYDGLTSTIEDARKGCVFAMDTKGLGWHNFSMEIEKKSSKLYQDGYPIKIKGLEKKSVILCQDVYRIKIKAMFMINPPLILSVFIKICKVFLKKKLRDRMKNIKSEALPEHFDMSELPTELGGTFDTPFRVTPKP